MAWPSWEDTLSKIKQFEQRLSDVEIKGIEYVKKFQDRHPILDGIVKGATPLLPPPINDIVQGIYENARDPIEGTTEVLEYLKKIKDQGKEHYEEIVRTLDSIKYDMAKEETQIIIKDILISTGGILKEKLVILKSLEEKISDIQETVHGIANTLNETQEKSLSFNPKPKSFIGESKIFTGREKEIKEISEFLEQNQIITIVGEGGIGKTSLSIKIVKNCEDKFDIIIPFYFVALKTFDDLLLNIAKRIGVSLESFSKLELEEKKEIILEKLQEHSLILILCDNYEIITNHFKEREPDMDAKNIQNFLENLPDNVKILVTSRTKDNFPNEKIIEIDGLVEEHALNLFLKISQKYFPVEPSESIIQKIKHIVESVGGHPLAVEIMARNYKGGGEPELDNISEKIGSVASNPKSSIERMESLENCFKFSFENFDSSTEILLKKIMLLKSPFPAKIGKCLFGYDENKFFELNDQCLLRIIDNDEFGMFDREFWLYYIHPALRTYLEKHMPEDLSGLEKAITTCYGNHLSDLFGQVDKSERNQALRQFQIMIDQKESDVKIIPELIQDPELKARYYGLLGVLLTHIGAFRRAQEYYLKINGLFEKKFPISLLPILGNYCNLLARLGHLEKAYEMNNRMADIYESEGDILNAAMCYEHMALTKYRLGLADQGYPIMKNCLKLYEQAKGEKNMGYFHLNMGVIAKEIDTNEAKHHLEKSKNIFEKEKNVRGLSEYYVGIGLVYLKEKNYPNAIKFFKKSIETQIKLNDELKEAQSRLQLGIAYEQSNDLSNAINEFEKSLNVFEKYDDVINIVEAKFRIGHYYFKKKDIKKSFENHSKSYSLARQINKKNDLARAALALSGIYALNQNYETAIQLCNQGYSIHFEDKNFQHLKIAKLLLEQLILQINEDRTLSEENKKKYLKQIQDNTDRK